jgi:hypothetical protein
MSNTVPRINYEKDIDPWIKKNPEGKFIDFVKANRGVRISDWSFRKRQAKVLGLPLTPSMTDGYRSPKNGDRQTRTSRSRNLYSTVFSLPASELKGKNGFEAMSILIKALNDHFRLNLQMVQAEVMGSGTQQFELRKYQ